MAYKNLLASRKNCPQVIDADASVVLSNLIFKGTVKGYLQAMAPKYIRFEALNPLGLVEAVLVTDGIDFQYLVVREQKSYSGKLDADKLTEYVPREVLVSFVYNWFLARPDLTGENVKEIGRDPDGRGYWLSLGSDGGQRVEILFDPEQMAITRHLVLTEDETLLLDLLYRFSESSPQITGAISKKNDTCPLPQEIILKTSGSQSLTVAFDKQYPVGRLGKDRFTIKIPPTFERIDIK